MPSNLAPHQIYSSQLEQLKYGYALWCPEPETGRDFQYAEVRPGDVGYFQEGGFCRLFNVSLPEDDQENSLGVPDGFEPLHLPKGGVLTRDPFLPAQALRSSSVYDVERSAKAGGDLQVVSAGAGVGYSCSKKRGALLNLSQPLKSERILAGIHIKNYVRQHYQSWYDFASALGRDIETGVIVLVTGCMKTYEWTSAVFNNTSKDTKLWVKAGAHGISADVDYSGKRKDNLSVQHRSGPKHLGSGPPKVDQSVFITGYNVLPRRWLSFKLMGAAEPQPLRSPDDGAGSRDVVIEEFPPKSKVYHPGNALLEYLLEHTDEDVAIVHDDVWCAQDTIPEAALHPALPADCPLIADIIGAYERSFFGDDGAYSESGFGETDGEFVTTVGLEEVSVETIPPGDNISNRKNKISSWGSTTDTIHGGVGGVGGVGGSGGHGGFGGHGGGLGEGPIFPNSANWWDSNVSTLYYGAPGTIQVPNIGGNGGVGGHWDDIHRFKNLLIRGKFGGGQIKHGIADLEARDAHIPHLTVTEFCEKYLLSDKFCRQLVDEGFETTGGLLEASEPVLERAGLKVGQIAELKRALREFLVAETNSE